MDTGLYELIFVYSILIVVFVILLMVWVVKAPFYTKMMVHGAFLEFIWTLIPLILLIAIAVPSMTYLYLAEACLSPALNVKVVGHQWYWTYFYSDLGLQLDSYMKSGESLALGDTFLLETETPCVIPFGVNLQFLVTSEDVLHSWTVPNLGMKVDAIPGVLSSIITEVPFPGLYLGMCSEMCGALHSYMPINLEVSSMGGWLAWAKGGLSP